MRSIASTPEHSMPSTFGPEEWGVGMAEEESYASARRCEEDDSIIVVVDLVNIVVFPIEYP
jgi:hypothetical protein